MAGILGGIVGGLVNRAKNETKKKVEQAVREKTGGTVQSGAPSGTTSYISPSGEKKTGVFGSSSGYREYVKGENPGLESQLSQYSDAYAQARAAGDPEGMRAANDAANQLRNQYGYAAVYANEDIDQVKRQAGYNGGLSGGGSYSGGSTGGSANESYAALIEESRRAQEAEAQAAEAAKRAAVEQAVGRLDQQKQGVEQSYSDLYRQLYINRRMAEKNLPQQMAAMGYTGGLTESSALALQTGYADALRQGEQQKIGTLSELDRAIADTQLQGDISIAEQAAEMARQGFATYADLVKAQLNQQNLDRQFGLNLDQYEHDKSLDERDFGYQQTQADRDWQYKLWSMSRQELLDAVQRSDLEEEKRIQAAQYLYEHSGNADGFRLLGYTEEQIAGLEQNHATTLAQNSENSSGSGGGGGGSAAYKPRLTFPQVTEVASGWGPVSPVVEADFEYYYGMSVDEWRAAQEAAKSGGGPVVLGQRAENLKMQLSNVPGLMEENKVAMIADALNHGEISQREADILLDYIGY